VAGETFSARTIFKCDLGLRGPGGVPPLALKLLKYSKYKP
jgi:hypothetical protein